MTMIATVCESPLNQWTFGGRFGSVAVARKGEAFTLKLPISRLCRTSPLFGVDLL